MAEILDSEHFNEIFTHCVQAVPRNSFKFHKVALLKVFKTEENVVT